MQDTTIAQAASEARAQAAEMMATAILGSIEDYAEAFDLRARFSRRHNQWTVYGPAYRGTFAGGEVAKLRIAADTATETVTIQRLTGNNVEIGVDVEAPFSTDPQELQETIAAAIADLAGAAFESLQP